MMINLTNTSANFDLFSKVLFVVDQNEEDICRRAAEAAAAEAAAAEVGCTCGVSAKNAKLFCDSTGNYAEVVLPAGQEYTCGMKLCCIVDTDTMEVCGICPIN